MREVIKNGSMWTRNNKQMGAGGGGGGEDESFEVCVKENFIQFFFMFRYLFGPL